MWIAAWAPACTTYIAALVRVAAYTDCLAILAFFVLGGIIPAWFMRVQAVPQRRVGHALLIEALRACVGLPLTHSGFASAPCSDS
jgi:hypothetical protein